jgi:hypothetical protein
MPPRAVWKIRPSGVVPYRLMCAEPPEQLGGMGMVLISVAARCLSPRFWQEVPLSIQVFPHNSSGNGGDHRVASLSRDCVTVQAADAVGRVERLFDMRENNRSRIRESSGKHPR